MMNIKIYFICSNLCCLFAWLCMCMCPCFLYFRLLLYILWYIFSMSAVIWRIKLHIFIFIYHEWLRHKQYTRIYPQKYMLLSILSMNKVCSPDRQTDGRNWSSNRRHYAVKCIGLQKLLGKCVCQLQTLFYVLLLGTITLSDPGVTGSAYRGAVFTRGTATAQAFVVIFSGYWGIWDQFHCIMKHWSSNASLCSEIDFKCLSTHWKSPQMPAQ